MEPNTPVTLAVAAYSQPLVAHEDFAAVWESIQSDSRRFAVAELERNAAGTLRVTRHRSGPVNPAWGSALLAATLVMFVAPAGAGFLSSVPSVGGAGAVASHLHRTVSRRERDRATTLLEEHGSGVVVVAADREPSDIEALLGRADGSMAMTTVWDGLDRAIEQEIADAQAQPERDLNTPCTSWRWVGADMPDDAPVPPGTEVTSTRPTHWRELDRRGRRHELLQTGLAVAATWVLLLAIYYAVPFDDRTSDDWLVRLVLGGVVFITVLVWQLRSVTGADRPILRAVQALGGVLPLFLVIFASVYLSLSETSAGNFSEPLNHSGALYFTVTIFSTVGFGDITPETDLTRLLVSGQMLLDLVLIGVVVRLLTTAVTSGTAGATPDPTR